MESFGILRTHTGLSSNVKVVIDSEYNLFIETIDSVDELSADRFKKIQFNKSSYYDELVPFLFKNVPVDISFSIKYENDNFDMSLDFANQYDDIYLSGARNISNNKDYKEEYEYFAPLYVFKHHLPKYFIIFRVDGPGLIKMTKDNFKTEFLNKFKTVKIFDLTRNSPLGEWVDTNFASNSSFPVAPLEVDFKKLEFTRWIGIDYESGGYTSKPFYLEENLENENTLFDFEKFFLDGYKINKVVFPHIINFNYLFDDEPATPQTLRKWSINRYSGFYLNDIEIIDSITPYKMPKLHGDVIIESGNILKSLSFDVPFIDGWRDDIDMWVEYLGNFYKVIKIEEESQRSVVRSKDDRYKRLTIEEIKNPIVTKYKIVSDIDLTNKESFLNIRTCYINLQNEIVDLSGSPYVINDFDFADVNLIEINGVFHNIIKENNILKLNTDYGFKFSEDNNFTYFINSEKEGYSFSWDLLISKTNLPKNWKIYRLRFSDVKDFDTNIIDTEFARHEYEKRDDLTRTEEPKMYLTDLRSKSLPQDFDDFIFKGKTEFVPVASDYTANLETFRVEGNKLTDLWRKNPIYCRWGYQNSTSAYDYPYMLNNNDVEGEWNLTCDTRNIIPDRPSRNLDYFYTLNSGTTSHLYHSLHVEQNYLNVQDTSFRFELDKYLELGTFSQLGTTYSYDFDYFDILFSKTASFLDGELIQNRKKYSYFEAGDRVIPNTTVFRGLKWRLFEVDNIKSNSLNIENINLFSSNFFQDYKFSVLLSSNDLMVYDDNQLYNPYYWDYFIDEKDNLTSLSLLSGFSSTPSNVRAGDLIELDQFYPYDNLIYQQSLQPVIGVGSLNLGGYGIILNEGWLGNNDVTEGIWRNKMQWKVIKKWEWDRSYTPGDLLIYEDQIFEVVTGATVSDPNQDPFTLPSEFIKNSPNAITYPTYFMLWSNNYNGYLTNEWVYHFGEYYKKTSNFTTPLVDFWNPTLGYTVSSPPEVVNYENRYFECIFPVTSGIRPQVNNKKSGSSSGDIFWREVPESSVTNKVWEKIELWDRNVSAYNAGEYVVYNNTLYQSLIQSTIDDIPGESESVWTRVYSFVPDTDFKYSSLINPMIIMNDSFYYCQYNPGENNSDCKSLCFRGSVAYDTNLKDSIIAEIESSQGSPTGTEGEDWYFSNKDGEILNYNDYNINNWNFSKIDVDCSLEFKSGDFRLNVFLPQTSPDDCKGDLTLDNGITIYINKKWKNVLVNISINDNTIHSTNQKVLDETKNIERDELYVETNKRLTAANIIQQINDLDTLYGFADFTTYVVIEEDGTFKKYNFNNKINELPYMMIVEEPDEFDLRDDTLRYSLSTVDKNVLKSNRFLVNGNIDNLEKIDFYNELPLGTIINNVKGEPGISINYNSQKDQISSKLHRHSGYYMPIFYEIELFNNAQLYDSGALCNIQFIVWLGTAVGTTQSITLSFSDSDNSVIKDVVLELPEDDGEPEVTDFYDQIINVIESEEIFSEVDFEFEILEPGNENIHPRMANGYWVLSMSYHRPCDIRISVIDESPCKLILQYFFEEYNYIAEDILSAIDSGPFVVPISNDNLCCPDCGPQLLGFLQYTENGSGNETFKNLYDEYIGEDLPVCDVMKHAVATPSNDQFNLWFTGTVNNNAEFTTVIANLSGQSAQQADIFGIGQYGSPNLLTAFVNLVQQSDYPDLLFKELLERGIVINCEDENYIVNRSPFPVIEQIPIEEICVRYILTSSEVNIDGYSTFQLNQNGDYEGSFNNINYIIVNENGNWKVKQDETVVASNSSLIGTYNDEFTDSGYNESFIVSEGVCSETSPLFLPNLCMSIARSPSGISDVLKINLIWDTNENAYIGYEQPSLASQLAEGGFVFRKYSIRLVNARWELYYEDVVSISGPSFNGPDTLISRMSEIFPVPISSNWQRTFGVGLINQHSFGEKSRVLINTSSSC